MTRTQQHKATRKLIIGGGVVGGGGKEVPKKPKTRKAPSKAPSARKVLFKSRKPPGKLHKCRKADDLKPAGKPTLRQVIVSCFGKLIFFITVAMI